MALQWGRDLTVADMRNASHWDTVITDWLQWGRDLTVADIQ